MSRFRLHPSTRSRLYNPFHEESVKTQTLLLCIGHSLAFLQGDLSGLEFHQHAIRRSRGFYDGLHALVKDAFTVGELKRCRSDRLARALQATLNGSILEWVVH